MLTLLQFAVLVVVVVGMWKVYEKAGKPGWAAIIPVYNIWVLLEMTGKPGWWIVLFFVPIVNVVIAILVTAELAKRFGQGTGFVVGLILLPFVFYPILGFGEARYSQSQ